MATGNQITGQTLAMNFAFNTFTNGAGSVSTKKGAKADVNTGKPNKSRTPVQAVDGNGNKVYGEVLEPGYTHKKPVKDVTPNASTPQKRISGPDPNASRLEAPKDSSYEPFLPDDYYKQRLSERVSPGTRYLHKHSVDGDIVQTKFYDAHGREKGWVDYTTHNQPGHTNPHSHQRIYNQHTPEQGYKIDYRTDPSFPKWLGD